MPSEGSPKIRVPLEEEHELAGHHSEWMRARIPLDSSAEGEEPSHFRE